MPIKYMYTFSFRFMVICSYCILDEKNINMKSTFQLFPLTICNVFFVVYSQEIYVQTMRKNQ